jgi:diacylglycerol kinase (ATP)
MKKYVFVINPSAGPNRKDLSEPIQSHMLLKNKPFEILKTAYAGHAQELIKERLSQKNCVFVAVGGDGTINEVASMLISETQVLGIIPAGSGNGLARTLGIPSRLEEALDIILNGSGFDLDIGFINQRPFFCTAGLGFDAKCARDFAESKHGRGLKNYIKVFFKNYFSYKAEILKINDSEKGFFSVTFANASQYGNDTFIAPLAKVDDGLLDMVLVKPHHKWSGLGIAWNLFRKKIHLSKFVEYQTGKDFHLDFIQEPNIHIDGEYLDLKTKKVNISLKEKALKVLIKKR